MQLSQQCYHSDHSPEAGDVYYDGDDMSEWIEAGDVHYDGDDVSEWIGVGDVHYESDVQCCLRLGGQYLGCPRTYRASQDSLPPLIYTSPTMHGGHGQSWDVPSHTCPEDPMHTHMQVHPTWGVPHGASHICRYIPHGASHICRYIPHGASHICS